MPAPLRSALVQIADPAPQREGAKRWGMVMLAIALFTVVVHLLPLSKKLGDVLSLGLAALAPIAVGIYRKTCGPTDLKGALVSVEPGAIVLTGAHGIAERFDLDPAGAVWVDDKGAGHEIVAVLTGERVLRARVGDRTTATRFAKMIRRARGPTVETTAFGRLPTDVLDDGGGLGALFALSFVPLFFSYFILGMSETRVGLALTFVVALSFAVVGIVLARRARPHRLELGKDGLALRVGSVDLPTFIPFGRIADACADEDEIVLSLVGMWQARLDAGRRTSAKALAKEIRRRARRSRRGHVRAAAHLARKDRSREAWKSDLARIVTEGHYRTARVGVADLLSVVESPEVPVEQRIGAALAVSACGDSEAADRVRVAALQYVEPALVRALGAAADGEIDEAAIAEAERALSRR